MMEADPILDPALPDEDADARAVLREKLLDAMTPGFAAECSPEEAERLGAFVEDAMSEQDALESSIDLADAQAPAVKE